MNAYQSLFTTEQKHYIVFTLTLIIHGCNDSRIKKTKEGKLAEALELMNINLKDYKTFVDSSAKDQLPQAMQALNNNQKELLYALLHEMLMCSGMPSSRDYDITINVLENVMGVPESIFLEFIEKMNTYSKNFQ